MGAFFWGGLGKGLGRGIEDAQNLQLKRDEAKLRTRMLDAQIKHQEAQHRVWDQKELDFKRLRDTRNEMGSLYERMVTGSTPGAPMTEEPGDPAIGTEQVQGQPGAGKVGRPMDTREMLTKAVIQDPHHQIPSELFKSPESRIPTTLEGLAVQKLVSGDRPGAENVLGMKRDPTADLGNLREALSLQHFGVPTSKLTQEQRGIVNQKAQEYEINLAGTRAGATAEARRDVQQTTPLSPSDAGQLGVPYGTKPTEAYGKQPLTTVARNTALAMKSAESVLDQLEELSLGKVNPKSGQREGGISTATSPTERVMQAPGRFAGVLSQSNTEAVKYQSLAKGMLAAFSRSVGGERGATTEQDVQRAEQLIPSIYDTRDVAQGKVKQLRELIQEIGNRAKGGSTMPSEAGGGLPPPPPGWK